MTLGICNELWFEQPQSSSLGLIAGMISSSVWPLGKERQDGTWI